MKQHVEEYMQTVQQDQFTIVFGQVRVGKRIIRYAGAALCNREDKNNKEIGKNLATARAMDDLGEQMKFIARKMEKKAYKQVHSRMQFRTEIDPDASEVRDVLEQLEHLCESTVTNETETTAVVQPIPYTDEDIMTFLITPNAKTQAKLFNITPTTIYQWRKLISSKGLSALSNWARETILSKYMEKHVVPSNGDNADEPAAFTIEQRYTDQQIRDFFSRYTYAQLGKYLSVSDDSAKAWKIRFNRKGWEALTDRAKESINTALYLTGYIPTNYSNLTEEITED